MTPADVAIAGLIGHLTTPFVSLACRRHWPAEAKFAIATLLALVAAAASTTLTAGAPSVEHFMATFGSAFAAQQATWHLELPGAGSPRVNRRLEDLGSHPR